MTVLEIEPMNLGEDVRAVGLDLLEGDSDREPTRGRDAAEAWAVAIPALAGREPWLLDFFGHSDRARAFCESRQIGFRAISGRFVAITPPAGDDMRKLFERFASETIGIRAGNRIGAPDPALEEEIALHGFDAYHLAYPSYFFCGICDFENGSLVVLSNHLWASEIARRVRSALNCLNIQVQIAF